MVVRLWSGHRPCDWETNQPRKPVSWRGTDLDSQVGQMDGAMGCLLLAPHDPEQFRTAVGTDSLDSGTTVFHGYFLRFRHLLLCLALHTIRFSHGACLPWVRISLRKLGVHLTGSGQ